MILVLLLISIFSSVIGRIFLFLSKPCNFCKFFLLWQKLCMKDIQILKLMLFFPRDSSLFPQLNRKHEEQIMLIHLETEPGPCWVIALVRLSLLLTPQVCFRPLPFEEYCLLSTTRLQETLLCFFSSVHSLPQRLSTQNVSYGEPRPQLWSFSRFQFTHQPTQSSKAFLILLPFRIVSPFMVNVFLRNAQTR